MPNIIWNGNPGERWVNDTGVARYQFFASLVNTCGVCLPVPPRHRTHLADPFT